MYNVNLAWEDILTIQGLLIVSSHDKKNHDNESRKEYIKLNNIITKQIKKQVK